MIESVLTFGVVIFGGLALLFAKLPRGTRLWLLGHALALDVAVTLLALAIHWGTVTGLMAAAVAGVMCSFATSAARRLWGYRVRGRVIPGVLS
jgi:hypothetical protein